MGNVESHKIPSPNQKFDIGRVINPFENFEKWRDGENYALKTVTKLMTVKRYIELGGKIEDEKSPYLIDNFQNFLECCVKQFPKGLYYNAQRRSERIEISLIRFARGHEIEVGNISIDTREAKYKIGKCSSDSTESFAIYLAKKISLFYDYLIMPFHDYDYEVPRERKMFYRGIKAKDLGMTFDVSKMGHYAGMLKILNDYYPEWEVMSEEEQNKFVLQEFEFVGGGGGAFIVDDNGSAEYFIKRVQKEY